MSSELANRISSRLPRSDFGTIDEYVSYVMGQVLDELESSSSNSKQATQETPETEFSKEDQKNVEQRLRDLGYL